MTQRCVSTLLDRVREVTRMEQQAEKLSALGKLAGNLAHELNNPASAAQRSASSLFAELRHTATSSIASATSVSPTSRPPVPLLDLAHPQHMADYASRANVSDDPRRERPRDRPAPVARDS